jgi:hypothetical protein
MDRKQEVQPKTRKLDHILDRIIAHRLRFNQLVKHGNLSFFSPILEIGSNAF